MIIEIIYLIFYTLAIVQRTWVSLQSIRNYKFIFFVDVRCLAIYDYLRCERECFIAQQLSGEREAAEVNNTQNLARLEPLTIAGFLGDGTKVGVEVIYGAVLVTMNVLCATKLALLDVGQFTGTTDSIGMTLYFLTGSARTVAASREQIDRSSSLCLRVTRHATSTWWPVVARTSNRTGR